ncbi:four helix bundle protein [Patescibacteria group bacterium]|nr:four helix bundle protein [Patescibacteria group bacterium]
MKSYEDLTVWQKSIDLVVLIYKLTKKFPKEETYGLSSQIKRCAVSIPSNIAEGSRRGTKKDFRHFLFNSFGSGAELETQIKISKKLLLVDEQEFIEIDNILSEVMKMLNKLITILGNDKSE